METLRRSLKYYNPVMRLVIFTNQAPHHKLLCRELASRFEVAAIVHPRPSDDGFARSVRRFVRRVRARGILHSASTALAKTSFAGWRPGQDRDRIALGLWPEVSRDYEALSRSIPIYRGIDVNAAEGLRLVEDLRPDVVANLGGDIYREPIIRACRLMLNFHSGVSPLYNGTSTIDYAYSQGHFRMCGGTLMVMSPEIDGGDILAHVFPAIGPRDTPTDIFLRCVGMAPIAYASFLEHLSRVGSYSSIPQGRPMCLARGADWTVDRACAVHRHMGRGISAWDQRGARIVEYWREPDRAAAQAIFEREILRLVLSSPA
jgi:hypothetical protein